MIGPALETYVRRWRDDGQRARDTYMALRLSKMLSGWEWVLPRKRGRMTKRIEESMMSDVGCKNEENGNANDWNVRTKEWKIGQRLMIDSRPAL